MNTKVIKEVFRATENGGQVSIETLAKKSLSIKDRNRLFKVTQNDKERVLLLFTAGPALARASPKAKDTAFNLVEESPYKDAEFSPDGRNVDRLAGMLISGTQLANPSYHEKKAFFKIAGTELGYCSDDTRQMFIPLGRAFAALKNRPKKRADYLQGLVSIRERDVNGMKEAILPLADLVIAKDWRDVFESYIAPISDLPRETLRNKYGYVKDVWEDVPKELASRLAPLVGIDHNPARKVIAKLANISRSHDIYDAIVNECESQPLLPFAISLPTVVSRHPQLVDSYLRILEDKIREDNWNKNITSHYFEKAAGVLTTEEFAQILDYAITIPSWKLNYGLSEGVKAYPREGISGIKARVDLLSRITTQTHNEEQTLGSWILDEAETRLRHGEEAARRYVEAMEPVMEIKLPKKREVDRERRFFHHVNQSERYIDPNYPKEAMALFNLPTYQSLTGDEINKAHYFFQDLYGEDRKDGGNRRNVLVQTVADMHQQGKIDAAKKLLLSGDNGQLRYAFGLPGNVMTIRML